MTSVGTFPITLFTLLLLLAPGLIGLRLFYETSKRKFSLTRTRLIVYSSALSGFSVLTLYLSSFILLEYFVPLSQTIAGTLQVASEAEIGEIPLSGMVGLYFIHISLTFVIGAILGVGYRTYKFRRHNKLLDRREPWEFIFTKSPRDGEWIEVLLNNGEIIQGKFNHRAFDNDIRELFLDDPYSVEYSSSERGTTREDLGRSVYLSSDAIQRIVTIEEDPNASVTEHLEDYTIEDELREEIEKRLFSLENQTSLHDFEESNTEDSNEN